MLADFARHFLVDIILTIVPDEMKKAEILEEEAEVTEVGADDSLIEEVRAIVEVAVHVEVALVE